MKYLIVLLLIASSCQAQSIKTSFSPNGGATALVVEHIMSAKETIDLAAYQFTSYSVAHALCKAQERGVKVRMYLDKSQRKGKMTDLAVRCGIQVKIDHTSDPSRIMHHKFIVVDNKVTETGSFNYSERAESRNAENVIVIQDEAVAKAYEGEFNKLWDLK